MAKELTRDFQFAKLLAIITAACLVGCTSPRPGNNTRVVLNPDDTFLTIEWCGAESKPVRQTAFASQHELDQLKRWIDARPIARTGSIISKQEIFRVGVLLRQNLFSGCQTKAQPDVDILEAQYFITVHSSNSVWYYPLGYDRSTTKRLNALKSVLERSNGDLLNPIIEFAQRVP